MSTENHLRLWLIVNKYMRRNKITFLVKKKKKELVSQIIIFISSPPFITKGSYYGGEIWQEKEREIEKKDSSPLPYYYGSLFVSLFFIILFHIYFFKLKFMAEVEDQQTEMVG